MHQRVESAHAGERCVKRGLVAGEQWSGRVCRLLFEVVAKGCDLLPRAG